MLDVHVLTDNVWRPGSERHGYTTGPAQETTGFCEAAETSPSNYTLYCTYALQNRLSCIPFCSVSFFLQLDFYVGSFLRPTSMICYALLEHSSFCFIPKFFQLIGIIVETKARVVTGNFADRLHAYECQKVSRHTPLVCWSSHNEPLPSSIQIMFPPVYGYLRLCVDDLRKFMVA